MKQINLNNIDYSRLLPYVAILILSIFLFKSCQGSKELELNNADLKKEATELVASADKYIAKNNELNDKITVLEAQKQKVKKQIAYVQEKTQSGIEKVPALNTKQIATYYQERYKLPITITQYGVSLSDTVAKKNITELIQKEGCFEEIKLVKIDLDIEEKKGVAKDSINNNLTNANILLKDAVAGQDKIIGNAEKSVRKEKNKKTFWQVATGAITIGAGYLLIVK